MIDLHMHSTFSDGSLTPEELAEQGREIGLSAMALTDHDSTDGIPRFLAACELHGIRGVAGVEISAEVDRGTVHMLGYFVRRGDPALEDVLKKIRSGRELRNERILQKLNDRGLTLAWEEVARHAGEDVVGRPHFAKAMIERGYVSNKQEAFNRYLAKGACCYVDRFRFSAGDSIAAIAKAGGVAVLAHPFTLDLGRKALREYVGGLKAQGLGGIEVYYSEHTPDQARLYGEIARELNLAPSGGSDFHGELNPQIHIGRGFGSLNVPDDALTALEERRP